MGGCLSLRKRNTNVEHVDPAVLDELNRRFNALILQERNAVEIKEDYIESPNLALLNRRLFNLKKPLEDTSSINDEQEWEEDLKNGINTLECRLRALRSTMDDRNAAKDKTFNKKDIAKLKQAEEKLLEFEVRLGKLQKLIFIDGEAKL